MLELREENDADYLNEADFVLFWRRIKRMRTASVGYGKLALAIEALDEDGLPETIILNLQQSAYLMSPQSLAV